MRERSLFTAYSWLISSFMLASGAAALIYQVVWARLLSLSIGSTSVAIAAVIAAFFLGLALGAWLSETTTRQSNTIHQYIMLEATIGLTGLALLPILLNLDNLLVHWPDYMGNTSFKFFIVVLLLGIPTTCIGATFPVIVSLVSHQKNSKQPHVTDLRLGQLYGLNTAGGVLGAAMGGFIFIPQWGLDGSTYIAVGLNFSIVIAALLFAKLFMINMNRETLPKNNNQIPPPTHSISRPNVTLRKQALWVLFITGVVSLACEVAWTKYLAIYTHTTIYGFAAILSIFLTGIALGAWAINHWLNRITQPQLWISGGLLALASNLILTQVGLNALPDLQEILFNTSHDAILIESSKYFLVFGLLFLPTFLFGVLFTLNIRIACGTTDSLTHPVGKAYAINTLGGIIGAIGAGMWIIPLFGTSAVLSAGIIIILLTALIFFIPVFASAKHISINKHTRLKLAVAAGLLAAITFLLPPLDFRHVITAGAYYFQPKVDDFQNSPYKFLREGRSGVVSVVSWNGQDFELQKNGLPESDFNPGHPHTLLTETLLGLAPWLLHPKPVNAFVIGLGGATTVQALTLTDLTSIRVLEIEPVVYDAVSAIHGGEVPALQDPRVKLVLDDARQRLLLEDQNYDLIISQPSHPWLAGGANLFSREFFHLAGSRLTADGIYTQWINMFHMDTQTLQSILQSFFDEFSYGMSLIVFDENSLLLLGSQVPLRLNTPALQTRLSQPAINEILDSRDLRHPSDLLRYLALSREEALQAADNAIPATDTNLLPEVRLGRLNQAPTGKDNPYTLLRKHFQFDIAAYYEKENLKQRYLELAEYFQQFDPQRARLIRKNLEQ